MLLNGYCMTHLEKSLYLSYLEIGELMTSLLLVDSGSIGQWITNQLNYLIN